MPILLLDGAGNYKKIHFHKIRTHSLVPNKCKKWGSAGGQIQRFSLYKKRSKIAPPEKRSRVVLTTPRFVTYQKLTRLPVRTAPCIPRESQAIAWSSVNPVWKLTSIFRRRDKNDEQLKRSIATPYGAFDISTLQDPSASCPTAGHSQPPRAPFAVNNHLIPRGRSNNTYQKNNGVQEHSLRVLLLRRRREKAWKCAEGQQQGRRGGARRRALRLHLRASWRGESRS